MINYALVSMILLALTVLHDLKEYEGDIKLRSTKYVLYCIMMLSSICLILNVINHYLSIT